MEALFECTLEMISKNLEEFLEHRTNFSACFNPSQLTAFQVNCVLCYLSSLSLAPFLHSLSLYLFSFSLCLFSLFLSLSLSLVLILGRPFVLVAVLSFLVHYFLVCVFVSLSLSTAFLQIPAPQFKIFMDSVVLAFKHTMRNVAEIGLNILMTLLHKFAASDVAGASFFQTYFCDLM